MTEADKLWNEPTEEEEDDCEKTIKRIGIAILIAVAVGLVAFKCFGFTLFKRPTLRTLGTGLKLLVAVNSVLDARI